MSTDTVDVGTVDGAELLLDDPPSAQPPPPEPTHDGEFIEEVDPRQGVVATTAAAFLATAGAGWMVAGVFLGAMPRWLALVAALVGSAVIGLSYRTRRPATLQYLALPLAVVLGGAVVLLDPAAAGASLPSLVQEALRGGGIAQPPVPFDPGWRFLLVAGVTLLGAAAASLATGLDRPRIGVLLPLPLLFLATLVQPPEAELVSTVVALVLVIAALGVAYGVDLAREGATTGRFEVRRLARGLGALVLLAGALVGLAQVAEGLLPDPREQEVIPPQRPQPPPPIEDRELFVVDSPRVLPWRLGVLDVYDGTAWLTPPFAPASFVDVDDGPLPDAPPPGEAGTFEVMFTVEGLAGRAIPTVGGARTVDAGGALMQIDPRTQALRLPEQRATAGLTYTVEAVTPASAAQLQAAAPPPRSLDEFLEVPAPPPEVRALLAAAPRDNAFDRLQFVRQSYYREVIAAGAGNPVDVPPARVAEMLRGEEATPFEISAGEALLARWAGVPSRLGYGYYKGDSVDGSDTRFSVRPKHGATWLEVYFEGSGWIPLVGTPPRAQSSLTDEQTNPDPAVRPTDELALIVHVPVRLEGLQLLYTIVRYWLLRAVAVLALLVALRILFPALVRRLRRARRRRWGERAGPAGRVAVAYAELRDAATDLNIGHASQTPLEFVDTVQSDREHAELAWLVTRVLWGDLARDARDEEAAVAEEMARSVLRRLRQAQPGFARLLALGSAASLREPYSDDVPNLWRRRRRGGWRRRLRSLRPRRAIRASASVLLVVVAVAALPNCARTAAEDVAAAPVELPEELVPERLGDIEIRREEDAEAAFAQAGEAGLVADGRVYSIRRGDAIEGSLQIGAFEPDLLTRSTDVIDGMLRAIGAGQFEPTRVGDERLYTLDLPEQRLLLWFPPDVEYYVLLVARRGFTDAEDVLGAVLAYQRGEDPGTAGQERVPPLDPRRGVPA